MKKLLSLLLILGLLVTALASCSDPSTGENPGGDNTPPAEEPSDYCEYAETRDVTGRNVAKIAMKVKDFGTVKLLLDATTAPVTVANFLSLVKDGFLDGMPFFSAQYITETAMVIMSGSPDGDGISTSDEEIVGECYYNGHENDISHKRGVIAMLHSQYSYDDATSHFYILNGDVPSLDGYYATFGYVTEGLTVIDAIIEHGMAYTTNQGLIHSARQPIIESVTVEQDIDYVSLRDKYIVPPTTAELDESHGAKRFSYIKNTFANEVIERIYVANNGGYVFQIVKDEDIFTNLLISVTTEGYIGNFSSIAANEAHDVLDGYESFYEKTYDEIKELPDSELKEYVMHVLRAYTAIKSDNSVSKYVYTRDTEGREIYTVELKVKDYETPVVILLDKTTAPVTVENFLGLVERGFYDGLVFHRIIQGFMIQGGDDSHLPTEEQAPSITGEFASNGHENDINHIRGTISMARSSDPNSAASGFFICSGDSNHLDGDYAAFGYVISGMATVDALVLYANGKTDSNGVIITSGEEPVIEYIKIVENN